LDQWCLETAEARPGLHQHAQCRSVACHSGQLLVNLPLYISFISSYHCKMVCSCARWLGLLGMRFCPATVWHISNTDVRPETLTCRVCSRKHLHNWRALAAAKRTQARPYHWAQPYRSAVLIDWSPAISAKLPAQAAARSLALGDLAHNC
jgi:hypothetical protein